MTKGKAFDAAREMIIHAKNNFKSVYAMLDTIEITAENLEKDLTENGDGLHWRKRMTARKTAEYLLRYARQCMARLTVNEHKEV
jgi:hypothetical protein